MTREEEIRQAAKEAYIQHISNGGYGSKYDFVNGYIACANKYNQWHKVTDELPPRRSETSCLSIKVFGSDGRDIIKTFYNYFHECWYVHYDEHYIITHWRELPELPKEE